MRIASPDVSESPPTPPNRRRKHLRRAPPTPSTISRDPQNQSSPSYSMPSRSPTDGGEDLDAVSESEFGSCSDSRSFYASDSIQPSYINVAPLPVFRGEPSECPVAHLARFDRVCRANNATSVDTLVRIFPVTLDGDAALWYDLAVERCRPAMLWPDIRSAFLQAFTRPDFADRARSELMSMRQRDGEGVNSYHLRLQWILRKWPDHGFPDALLKGIFIDGLKEDYQDWILPQRPEKLADAVRLALSWEQARSVREARRGNIDGGGEVKCGFCDGDHEERGCEVRRRMKELWLRSKEGVVPVLSPSMSLVRRGGGGDEGEGALGRTGSMRRGGQCQCWKHQCWKKLDRSSSSIGAAADANATAAE
ncbi:hypothetical protein B296_00010065 [Ensete ventricosum]|uniref:Retrotransposon gag domain-containing protein n=1 Tax=Ensete ventricosum TaxID=4639 RepID=A0A426Z5H5_ENSVE|nr:hypothetical protein B296_00010065 [Ensete ventricosum]